MDRDPRYNLCHFICCGHLVFLAFIRRSDQLFLIKNRIENMDAKRTGQLVTLPIYFWAVNIAAYSNAHIFFLVQISFFDHRVTCVRLPE